MNRKTALKGIFELTVFHPAQLFSGISLEIKKTWSTHSLSLSRERWYYVGT